MADASDLDARAIVAQGFLQAPLHKSRVAALIHVDEVDDDEASEIAQLYPQATLLTGKQATRAAFLSRLHDSEVVHFAGQVALA